MSINQTFNGVVYPIPTQGDLNWAAPLDRYLIALGTYALAPSGGLFTLTADVNFGNNFGLISKYLTSESNGTATSGMLRLAHNDIVSWRNAAGTGNLNLTTDGSDNLTFNGSVVPTGLATLANGKIWIGSAGNAPVAQTLTGDVTVTNGGVTSIGAGVIVNSEINAAAAIAYSKLNLTGSIVNADIFSSAAIALTKLASLNASIVPVTNGSGFLTSSAVTSTELGYVSGVTSALQTQINAKQASGNYITALTGDVTATGPGSVASTLAAVNSNVGSFTLASITVNAKGLITAASNGSAGAGTVTSVSGTANQIAVATGTTTPVLSITSPVVLPGAATVTGNLTFSPTTAGIVGTTTNNNTAAGNVGEYVESVVGSTAFPTTSVYGDLTSISLTAGDWDVSANFLFLRNGCSINDMEIGISTVSGNSSAGLVAGNNDARYALTVGVTTLSQLSLCIPVYRLSISSTTTVYFKFQGDYTVATPNGLGRLSARRMR